MIRVASSANGGPSVATLGGCAKPGPALRSPLRFRLGPGIVPAPDTEDCVQTEGAAPRGTGEPQRELHEIAGERGEDPQQGCEGDPAIDRFGCRPADKGRPV
jgi:hypothetical protein